MEESKETFFALSTPVGRSATATIRISGEVALAALLQLSKKEIKEIKHSKTFVTDIYSKNNCLIDNVIAVYYKNPKSYTGEDLVEIHTHGNPIIVNALSRELSLMGIRIAEPGEFTKTAFCNKKLDLIQAESILTLINSKSSAGVSLSLNSASGSLTAFLKNTRKELVFASSLLEYELDVSEIDNQKKTQEAVQKTLVKTLRKTEKLLSSGQSSRLLVSGARIVICGKPNVGKSTLFNSILKHNRSIVTSLAGTTRDTVEENLILNNQSVVFIDTAGIRDTKNIVERKGIERTNEEIDSADIVLFMVDANETKPPKDIIKNAIVIYNKIDLLQKSQLRVLKTNSKNSFFVSAKNKTGINKLLSKIEKTLFKTHIKDNDLFLTSSRQEQALYNIKKEIKPLVYNKEKNLELLAHHTTNAIGFFDNLLGKTSTDDILENVFSSFCVGK